MWIFNTMNLEAYPEFYIIAALIIFSLTLYAIFLHLKVRQQEDLQKSSADSLSQQLNTRQEGFRDSIRVIAAALVQGQVGLTEGAIRIDKLSSLLDEASGGDGRYKVFSQLAEATAHIPILENWKKLTKDEMIMFDKERASIEDSFQHSIRDAAQIILDVHSKKITKKEPLFYSVGK